MNIDNSKNLESLEHLLRISRSKTDIFPPELWSCRKSSNPSCRCQRMLGQGQRIWHSKSELEREYAKKTQMFFSTDRNMFKQSRRIPPVRFELKAYYFDCGTIPSVPLLASSVALATMAGRPCCHAAQLKVCSINLAKRKDKPEIQDGGTWPQSSEAKQQTN